MKSNEHLAQKMRKIRQYIPGELHCPISEHGSYCILCLRVVEHNKKEAQRLGLWYDYEQVRKKDCSP